MQRERQQMQRQQLQVIKSFEEMWLSNEKSF